jgi:hypothetical protein
VDSTNKKDVELLGFAGSLPPMIALAIWVFHNRAGGRMTSAASKRDVVGLYKDLHHP